LYRHLVVPLNRLRDRADALRADVPDPRAHCWNAVTSWVNWHRAFEHMAGRLREPGPAAPAVARCLTNCARPWRGASPMTATPPQLRERLDREVADMQKLLEDTLDLAWMDTEQPSLPTEPVLMLRYGKPLCQDVCFESGWDRARLPCSLVPTAWYRPIWTAWPKPWKTCCAMPFATRRRGRVSLDGWREGDCWHLRLSDQGPGVPDADLERIFKPYQRLADSSAGFGLGLASPAAPSSCKAAACGPAMATLACACMTLPEARTV
jgi:two-component system sensor histidine kinase PfeS